MIVLLIIVLIGVIFYGYFLMGRLDQFIERGGFIKEPEASKEKEILLYGEPETIDTISHALDVVSGIRTMAKCNNNIYENVFKQTDMIFQNDIPINRILDCLRG